MSGRLLDRQVELIEHLTSGAAIFGRGGAPARVPPGIHRGLLHLEARFSHEKRMAKIKWALPRTFELMGSQRELTIRDFVDACPPVSISRLDNARQFHDFLSMRWTIQDPEPPWLLDVAACELAQASARGNPARPSEALPGAVERGIRRHRNTILVRCRYDVRPILEGGAAAASVAERDTPLAVSTPPGAEHPIMSVLSVALFDLLAMLDDFIDADELSELPTVKDLFADLANRGLIEVRP
jgi:hypothetical protein